MQPLGQGNGNKAVLSLLKQSSAGIQNMCIAKHTVTIAMVECRKVIRLHELSVKCFVIMRVVLLTVVSDL